MNITALMTGTAPKIKSAITPQMRKAAKLLQPAEKTILEVKPKYTDEFGRVIESYPVHSGTYMVKFITRKDGAIIKSIGYPGKTPDVVTYVDSNKNLRRISVKDINDTIFGKDYIYTYAFKNGQRGPLIRKVPKYREVPANKIL